MYIRDLQQRSVIRYYVLRNKFKEEIYTKLSLGYSKDALCQRTVNTWATRFRSGRTFVEDDDSRGRFSRNDFSTAVSALWREIHMFYVVKSRKICSFQRLQFRGFWKRKVQDSSLQDGCPTSDRLSRRRTEWIFVKRCWRFWKNSIHDKRIMLLQVMNAGFTGIIITADNRQQIVRRYLLEFVPRFHRKDLDFGVFHSPWVCFNRNTSGNRTIQFFIFHWNNSSESRSIWESTSPEKSSLRLLAAYRQCETSRFCSVST
jgi:hypothetical protein